MRYDAQRASHAVVVCNYSGVRLDGYRIGVPQAGAYRELINTDAAVYGGGDTGNLENPRMPANPIASVSNVVATGREMNGAEMFIRPARGARAGLPAAAR